MTEQQPFDIIRHFPTFELRRYPASVVAEVNVRSSFDDAGSKAFRTLFGYINGANVAKQTLEMTAPVLQEPGGSQKISMTAPVLQSRDLGPTGADAAFVVAFVLPADMTEDSAPVPTSPDVRIRTSPGSIAAVVSFSGRGSEAAFSRRTDELRQAIHDAGLHPIGPPRFARFDPPYKPWFLRHNEVIQDVDGAPEESAR